MKVGFISNLYPPYVRGGAEHVVVRTVEGLSERGHDVFVISTRRKTATDAIEMSRNAEPVYRFYPKNLYYILDDYKNRVWRRLLWHVIDAFSPYPARRVEEILSGEQPDVVVTHNLKGIGLRIPGAIRKLKIAHVHVVHDLQLIYPSGLLFAGEEKKPKLYAPIYGAYRAVCRFLLGQPDLVIFPSSFLKDEYLKHGFFKRSKVEVLPNPAPEFQAVLRSGKPEGHFRLLFVGQLEYHKGIRLLLEAMKALPENVELIIAGEGTLSEEVATAAKADKRITYLGYIAIDQLISFFGIADALVVPILCYENSPTVIYESLQAGVPVIAADIGGVGELVQEPKNGVMFEPGNLEDYCRAVRNVIDKRDLYFESQGIIKATVADYGLSNYVGRLTDRFERILLARKEKNK